MLVLSFLSFLSLRCFFLYNDNLISHNVVKEMYIIIGKKRITSENLICHTTNFLIKYHFIKHTIVNHGIAKTIIYLYIFLNSNNNFFLFSYADYTCLSFSWEDIYIHLT